MLIALSGLGVLWGWLRDILEVLSFVHAQKVIHRDIKPDNIRRRPDGKVVLIDFGAVKQVGSQLSRPLGNAKAETSLTVAIGTPGYAPSEQTKGKPRLSSDVYAVGMIAIEALTGIEPEKLPEDPHTGELVWHDQAKVSPALRRVINRMVRYDFRQRYASAQEALDALETMGSAQATMVRSLEKLQQSPHFPKPWLWAGAATALLIFLTTFITLQFTRQPAVEDVSTDPVAQNIPQPTAAAPTNTTLPELAATVVPFSFTVTDAAYSSTLNRLVMVSSNPNQLYLYSPLSQRLQNLPLSSPPLRVAIAPQGRLAAVAHPNEISIIDLQQNQIKQVIPVTVPIHDVVLVSRQWVYFSSPQNDRLWGVDLQTEEVVASDTGDFTRTQHVLHPRRPALLSLDATGTQLRDVDIAQETPTLAREVNSNRKESMGDRLWLTPNGQTAFTNLGVRIPLTGSQDNFTSQSLALENLRAPSQGRIAIAAAGKQLFALDGPRMDRVVQFDPLTLKRQKTWQLASPSTPAASPRVTGRFVFVNPQGSEYYILVQGNDNGASQLWRGAF